MNSQNEAINTNYCIQYLYHRYIYMIEREACYKKPIVGCIKDAVKTHICISDNSKSDQMTIHIKRMSSDIDNSTIWVAYHSQYQSLFEILLPTQKYFETKTVVRIRIKDSLSKSEWLVQFYKRISLKYNSATSGFKSYIKLYDPF